VDKAGNPAGTLGTAYDISKRVKTIHDLQAQENYIRSIFRAAPHMELAELYDIFKRISSMASSSGYTPSYGYSRSMNNLLNTHLYGGGSNDIIWRDSRHDGS